MAGEFFDRIVQRVVQVERGERAALFWGFSWFFFLLLGYFVLRPVRETMGLAGGVRQLKSLFLATFVSMLIAVPVYSWLVARMSRRLVVWTVYHFFAFNLVVFWLAMRAGDVPSAWVARCFYVWVSVFSLFSVSVFWSVLTDLFSNAQAKRLFGFIAGGGTAGAIVGSLITSELVKQVGVANLLLIPIVLLEVGLYCARRLQQSATHFQRGRKHDPAASLPTGGNAFSGILHVLRSPYLMQICLYIFLISLCGTTVYFQQAEIVESSIADNEARTRLFAKLNLWVQVLTFFIQTLITGQLLRHLGLSVALCLLPATYALGFSGLGVRPTLAMLVVVDVARRAVAYGFTSPSREVLFTVVSREDKYKSKNFIDTVVYRGGDALTGQIFSALRGLGFGLAGIANLMISVTAVWAILGWSLGRTQAKLAKVATPANEN